MSTPEPSASSDTPDSGRLDLNIPQNLYSQLSALAEERGVPLNHLILEQLAQTAAPVAKPKRVARKTRNVINSPKGLIPWFG